MKYIGSQYKLCLLEELNFNFTRLHGIFLRNLKLCFVHFIINYITVFSLLSFAYNILLSISFNYYLFLCSQIYPCLLLFSIEFVS